MTFIHDSSLFNRQKIRRGRFENISSSTVSVNWQLPQKCNHASSCLFFFFGQTFIFSLFRKVLKYTCKFRFDLSWFVVMFIIILNECFSNSLTISKQCFSNFFFIFPFSILLKIKFRNKQWVITIVMMIF